MRRSIVFRIHAPQRIRHDGLAQVSFLVTAADTFVDGVIQITAGEHHVLPHFQEHTGKACILAERDALLSGDLDIILDLIENIGCALIPLAALCTFDGAQYIRRQIIVDLLYHSTDCIADLSDVKFSHFSNSPV